MPDIEPLMAALKSEYFDNKDAVRCDPPFVWNGNDDGIWLQFSGYAISLHKDGTWFWTATDGG